MSVNIFCIQGKNCIHLEFSCAPGLMKPYLMRFSSGKCFVSWTSLRPTVIILTSSTCEMKTRYIWSLHVYHMYFSSGKCFT
jgi:hypothetical protein